MEDRRIILLTDSPYDWDKLIKIIEKKKERVGKVEYIFIDCNKGYISSKINISHWNIVLVKRSRGLRKARDNKVKILNITSHIEQKENLTIGIHGEESIDLNEIGLAELPFKPKSTSFYTTRHEKFRLPIEGLIKAIENQQPCGELFDELWNAFNPKIPWRYEYFLEVPRLLLSLTEPDIEEIKRIVGEENEQGIYEQNCKLSDREKNTFLSLKKEIKTFLDNENERAKLYNNICSKLFQLAKEEREIYLKKLMPEE